jgi:hypothetical protein
VPAPLNVAIPSHDGRAEVVTVVTLTRDLAEALSRPVHIYLGEASNIPRARNVCVRLVESVLGEAARSEPLWLLWVDSDIRLAAGAAPHLAHYLARAEAERVAFAAPYRQANGRSTFFLRRARMAGPALEASAVQRLPDWSELGMCGFGLLYAPVEPGYVFHADDVGEDIHFWLDHPKLPLRCAQGVAIRHHKAVLL